MTQEQKRIKIAEACGWQEIRQSIKWECSDDPSCPQDLCGILADNRSHLLDYFFDLNAMHEAEKVLSDLNHGLFRRLLFTSYYNSGSDSDRRTNDEAERWRVSATAAQRAEAFGLTLKLWK